MSQSNSKQIFYTGIGSRETPPDVLELIYDISIKLERKGFIMRSGGASGADSAFSKYIKNKHIYYPWQGFSSDTPILEEAEPWVIPIIKKIHDYWDYLKLSEKKLHARNVHQILGHKGLMKTSEFVILYAKPKRYHENKIIDVFGGTNTAYRIAIENNVKIYNLYLEEDIEKIKMMLDDVKISTIDEEVNAFFSINQKSYEIK